MKDRSESPLNILTLLTVAGLAIMLSGCSPSAKMHLDGHQEAREAMLMGGEDAPDALPTVRLKVGEVIPATTPYKSIMPFAATGYWLSVVTEDPEIARAVPVDGSFFEGTNLEGGSPGRTRAVYGNVTNLHRPDPHPVAWDEVNPFWIEVTADGSYLEGNWVQAPDGKMAFESAEFNRDQAVIRYQENEDSVMRELSFPILEIGATHIYSAHDDVGMRYLLTEEDGVEVLHLEVPSEEYGKRELVLVKE